MPASGLVTLTWVTYEKYYPHVRDTVTGSLSVTTATTLLVPAPTAPSDRTKLQEVIVTYTESAVSWDDHDQNPIVYDIVSQFTTIVPVPTPIPTTDEPSLTGSDATSAVQPSAAATPPTRTDTFIVSATPSPSSSPTGTKNHRGLSAGSIAAIVICAVIGFLILAGLCIYTYRTRKARHTNTATQERYDKPELAAQDFAWWRRVFGATKPVELPARDEPAARAELEGDAPMVQELEGSGMGYDSSGKGHEEKRR